MIGRGKAATFPRRPKGHRPKTRIDADDDGSVDEAEHADDADMLEEHAASAFAAAEHDHDLMSGAISGETWPGERDFFGATATGIGFVGSQEWEH